MNKNPQESAPTNEQFNTVQNINDALEMAHKSARQGKVLASHVIKMAEAGITEDRAKLGNFPKSYPYFDVDTESVTMATNAELKSEGKDTIVDVWDSSIGTGLGASRMLDPVYRLSVTAKKIDGVEQPVSDDYLRKTNPDEWRKKHYKPVKKQHCSDRLIKTAAQSAVFISLKDKDLVAYKVRDSSSRPLSIISFTKPWKLTSTQPTSVTDNQSVYYNLQLTFIHAYAIINV